VTNHELSIVFFLQLTVILVAVRFVGFLARRIGQPQVVGEMIAGVLLGPSLLGALAPDLHARIFPQESIAIIYALSQVGLVLYMFLIGTEFSLEMIRVRFKSAIAVSWAGIAAPFAFGALLALLMLRSPGFFSPTILPWQAILFVGAAMSITAFPILARIILEKGLAGTALGTLALAAGSLDDAAAWCLLAVVLSSVGQDASIAILAIGGGVTYGLIVLFIGRRLLARLEAPVQRQGHLSGSMFAFILTLLMFASWLTDLVGIYAVFGAFILGIAMPRGIVTRELHSRIEPLATNFLLPLFFVFSGLNTQLGLLVSPNLWGMALLAILLATLGKGVGCWAAARLSGESQRDSLAVGILMNARGLMELILLNIGLQSGLISPTFFAIMVIMAIVTTLMTSPAFELVIRRYRRWEPPAPLPAQGQIH
jgi:Kef-type K+ transport system membrane component KefB